MDDDTQIEYSRFRDLAQSWREGAIREDELRELREALPELLNFASYRFAPVFQAWVELDSCTKAWQQRVAYCDANGIDHFTDVHTFVVELFWRLALISYGRHIYDLLGPPAEDSCTSAEMAEAEKSLVFWIDRLRTKEVE